MSDKAPKDVLHALHARLAESMADALSSGEVSPAGWSAISKFLRDNGVVAAIGLEGEADDKFADLVKRANALIDAHKINTQH